MSEWLSVEKELPELESRVIVWREPKDKLNHTRSAYAGEDKRHKEYCRHANPNGWGRTTPAFTVTHWMPLPKPPEGL